MKTKVTLARVIMLASSFEEKDKPKEHVFVFGTMYYTRISSSHAKANVVARVLGCWVLVKSPVNLRFPSILRTILSFRSPYFIFQAQINAGVVGRTVDRGVFCVDVTVCKHLCDRDNDCAASGCFIASI